MCLTLCAVRFPFIICELLICWADDTVTVCWPLLLVTMPEKVYCRLADTCSCASRPWRGVLFSEYCRGDTCVTKTRNMTSHNQARVNTSASAAVVVKISTTVITIAVPEIASSVVPSDAVVRPIVLGA